MSTSNNKIVDNSLGQALSVKSYQRGFIGQGYSITLKQFLEKPQYQLMSFMADEDKRKFKSSDDDLIFRCFNHDEKDLIDTGNYIGKISWPISVKKFLNIEIGSRFSTVFLQRMMSFANDVFLDDFDADSAKEAETNVAQYILHYMFVQALNKSYLLGLPKSYQSVFHHKTVVKGKVDFNRFIKADIPFKGRISSTSREQVEVQEIIDILHKAVSVATGGNLGLRQRVNHIVPHLRQAKSSRSVTSKTFKKALSAKAIQSPLFSSYKRVLKLAELIINRQGFEESKDAKEQGFGYLINVAELFEVYISKLLANNFPEWAISSPKIPLYSGLFYERKIIPDIVMKNGNKVVVFDTKYKRMENRGTKLGVWDLDRSDFFQIHTYMSFYQTDKTIDFLGGGLIYPLSTEYYKSTCFSPSVLNDEKPWFTVDGVEVPQSDSDLKGLHSELLQNENAFIERVQHLLIEPK